MLYSVPDMMPQNPVNHSVSKTPRFQSIDLLRGIAASSVVFYHVWNRYFPHLSTQGHPFSAPSNITLAYVCAFAFQYGYVGVTLFFVLSGFCIHLPQAHRNKTYGSDGLRLADFAQRRFWRIYPGYFASIVLSCVCLGALPLAAGLARGHIPNIFAIFGLKDAVVSALFGQFFYPDAFAFNGVYWTLVYEVQFYALYPLLLLLARRQGFPFAFVLLLSVESCCILWPLPIKHLFLDRYFEWFLGMYAAELVVSGSFHVRWAGIFLACIPLGILCTFWAFSWCWRDLVLSFGFCAMVLVTARWELARTHPGAPFRGFARHLFTIGLISYSLYLIHVPIIDVFWNLPMLAASKGVISSSLSTVLPLLSIPIAFICAYFSYHFFELPFLKSRSKTTHETVELQRNDAELPTLEIAN